MSTASERDHRRWLAEENRNNARRARAEREAERRFARDDRKIELLGQLCREGRTIYYAWTPSGRYRESSNPYDLTKYV